MSDCEPRAAVRAALYAGERQTLDGLVATAGLDPAARAAISAEAEDLVTAVRARGTPSLMQAFLGEYGLDSLEGVALMCLAEALLRVPDAETIDALISDKIVPADWGRHLGRSSSSLVNASTWALLLTGRVLGEDDDEDLAELLRDAMRRLGEPVIRAAVGQAMREMGRRFVLGRSIEEAATRAGEREGEGYRHSYDMLGEAARTEADAKRYHLAYSHAISELASHCRAGDVRDNPGISVKLSALHPRFEQAQRDRVLAELVPRALSLAVLAKSADMGFNIDAEEADRLDLSLDVIEALAGDPALAGWHGFGVVVQVYGPRAAPLLDWLGALAARHRRRLMVRLVKGAYWDTEIKRAQVLGLAGFQVFTAKAATDVSYIACAAKLLAMSDRLYPQFATHNAHSAAAVLHLAGGAEDFEFQRLHGMGEALHEELMARHGRRCRIYAPVGTHEDLLAYLVRRLLENGANSSFVNQIVDPSVSPRSIARDPFQVLEAARARPANPAIRRPSALFQPHRENARGWDLADPTTLSELDAERAPFAEFRWRAAPVIDGVAVEHGRAREAVNPARPEDVVGIVHEASPADVARAFEVVEAAGPDWGLSPPDERAAVLRRIAEAYEEAAAEFMALAAREAGKTLPDAVGEVREAVDFCRFYAREAERLAVREPAAPLGTVVCISPWNFPLAIFTGQIAAALAAGNAVLAKPAEQTPLIAARAVRLMHEAGVPPGALQLLPGDGARIGGALSAEPRTAGIAFTGSSETAARIHRALARHGRPEAPLIAETGGLNAMIVDSTALPEQAVRDIVTSAFQSAGQRCSALRMLYLQRDVEDTFLEMLLGAMAELRLGDPWDLGTDLGPLIDGGARDDIQAHCRRLEAEGRLLGKLDVPRGLDGFYVPPAIFRLDGIGELEREVFGPVLHLARFEADQLDAVVDAVNATGHGLTFGLHTRVDRRVQRVVERIQAGNLYVNRNQIGAVVGSQPFGGRGNSGTGPKAGGPNYLPRFRRRPDCRPGIALVLGTLSEAATLGHEMARLALLQPDWARRGDRPALLRALLGSAMAEPSAALEAAQALLDAPAELPGPTGESNRISLRPRGVFLVLGDDAAMVGALALANAVLMIDPPGPLASRLGEAGLPVVARAGPLDPADLVALPHLAGLVARGEAGPLTALRRALAAREGGIVALETGGDLRPFVHEQVLCIDTTAAGGNATLLAQADD